MISPALAIHGVLDRGKHMPLEKEAYLLEHLRNVLQVIDCQAGISQRLYPSLLQVVEGDDHVLVHVKAYLCQGLWEVPQVIGDYTLICEHLPSGLL